MRTWADLEYQSAVRPGVVRIAKVCCGSGAMPFVLVPPSAHAL